MTHSIGYLASYAYFKKIDMRRFKARIGNEPLFADSGAFTAKSKGETISLDNYARWLYRYHDAWDVYVNLDVIGSVSGSARNLQRLRNYGLAPVPVVHYGDSPAVMQKVLDDGATYVALGGMAFKAHFNDSMKWVESMFKVTPDNVDIHGFGFTRTEGMLEFPWRSVDSSSWLAGARYNNARLFVDGKFKTVDLSNPAKRREYAKDIEAHGANVQRFIDGTWHYKETFLLGAIAAFRLSEYWGSRARAHGWKQPRLYLAGAGDTLIHAAKAIRQYKRDQRYANS